MRTLLLDIRHAFRALRHSRTFSAMVIGILALGIAAAMAVFSLVDAVLLQPLPFRDPERLVRLHESRADSPGGPLSGHEVVAWRERTNTFEGIAVYQYDQVTLTGAGEPSVLDALAVSANYFDVLGVSAIVGRTFAHGEDLPGATEVVVLSHRLWQARFAADPRAITRTILLSNEPYRVVGVMPPGGRMEPDVWRPLDLALEARRVGRHSLFAFGRLRDGVPLRAGREDVEAAAADLARRMPAANAGHGAQVVPMLDDLVHGVRRPLLVAAGTVAFVLLIACANVAHLLLTRAAGRRKEVAIRAALGASRARLMRYLIVESLMLSLAAGALGSLLAAWVIDLLPSLTAIDVPRIGETAMNARVLASAVMLSIVTGLLCGILPALRASEPAAAGSLVQGARTVATVSPRVASLLATSEIALALVLLIGAALMGQSFVRLSSVNPGFNADHVLTAPVGLSSARYAAPARRLAFAEDLSARLRSAPGVRAVGTASHLPLAPGDNRMAFDIEGRPPGGPGDLRRVSVRVIGGDYFRAMEIPLRQGRWFSDADARVALPLIRWFEQQPLPPRFESPQPAPVAIVNESMAAAFWPGENPIGRRVRVLFSPWIEIVGIAADVRHASLASQPVAELYLSNLQEPQGAFAVLVKHDGREAGVASTLRAGVRELDADLPLPATTSMRELLHASLGRPRFETALVGVFSAIAVLLATLGIYGVTSYAVSQRTREIGIRTALGANRRDVLGLVLERAVLVTSVGIVVGLTGAFALTRVLSTLLFDIEPTDAATFAGVALLLAGASLVASYLPARRATTIDPLEALRGE